MTTKPTVKEVVAFLEENDDGTQFEIIQHTTAPYKHDLSSNKVVFVRHSDTTYWVVNFLSSYNNGWYTDEIDNHSISQVWPHQVTVTEYKVTPPDA